MSNSQLSHLTEARLLWIYVCEMLSCLLSIVFCLSIVYCPPPKNIIIVHKEIKQVDGHVFKWEQLDALTDDVE